MKLVCDRKALADATKAAAKFLPRMAHMAVLEHLHLEAHSNQLMVSATNLDAGRTVEVEADISEDGRILAPQNFAQIVAGAQGPSIEIESSDSDVTLSDGGSTWKLRLGDIEDYPEIDPTGTDESTVESWARLRAVATASGTKSDRPILQGVHFGDGYACATDSYRMAWTECEGPEALVPAAAIRNLDAPVSSLSFGDRYVSAVIEDGIWWSRFIDGSFPKWQSLVERHDPKATATVDAEVLADAVTRSLLVGESHIPVVLEVGDGIEVSRTIDGQRAYTEHVDAETDGEVRISFNPAYLRDLLAPVEKVTLTIEDEFKLARIDGGWWQAALMPIRT